jgi:hypothetical protein
MASRIGSWVISFWAATSLKKSSASTGMTYLYFKSIKEIERPSKKLRIMRVSLPQLLEDEPKHRTWGPQSEREHHCV